MLPSLVEHLGAALAQWGWHGWLLFVLIYGVCVTIYVPGTILTLLGGALFGLRFGVPAVALGAFLGMAGNWFLSRWWLRPWARRKLAQHPKLQRIERVLGRDRGWLLVFLLRLSPLFPFVLVNLACALSSLRFLPYMVASVAILPGTILYVLAGSSAGSLLGLQTMDSTVEQPLWLQLVGLGATFAVVWIVGRTASRVLKEQLDQPASSSGL